MAIARQKARVVDQSKIRKVCLTPAGYKSLKTELKTLEDKKPELSRKIGLTASFGDLPENHALDAAKEEEAFLDGRIAEIKAILRDAEILKPSGVDIVGLGSKVTLETESQRVAITLVDSLEADSTKGKVSPDSLLGQLLLGKKVGEELTVWTPAGPVIYKVLAIRC